MMIHALTKTCCWLALSIFLLTLTTGCTSKRPVVRTYTIGERAEAGLAFYTALEAVWKSQMGEEPAVRMPQNRFLLIRMRMTNSSPQEMSVPLMHLVAPSGEEYVELSDGAGVEDWLGVIRRLKPNETLFGWVLFDAPRGDYHLRVSDDAFDPADAKVALIQIPIRLESGAEYLPEAKEDR
jgi:hypothetical protein